MTHPLFSTCLAFGLLAAPVAWAADPGQQSNAPANKTDCIDLVRIDRSEVIDDQTIRFHMKGGRIWENKLPFKCPQLGFEKSFSYATSISKLCSVDTIRVFISGAAGPNGATCGLGDFTAYTPPPKPPKAAKPTG
jgi:hypothetical protein